jgi:glycerol-3-phosphate dehydrogenase
LDDAALSRHRLGLLWDGKIFFHARILCLKRNVKSLSEKQFDVAIIGGGIYGATAAWEAASRGLAVALVEKGDFGGATSANSLKIIHGGLRYLQHLDLARMRESIRERRAMVRIAPHLVDPLPVLIPTYGYGMQGRLVYRFALLANDLISIDRNQGSDPSKHIPGGRIFSRRQAMAMLPGIRSRGLTGAALFFDAQAHNTERLTLAFVSTAVQAGAVAANYVEADGFLRRAGHVAGITAIDKVTGDRIEIQAKSVLNAAGPWADEVLSRLDGRARTFGKGFAKAINVVLNRQIFPEYAVGLASKQRFRDADARLDKGSRLLFVAPWRGRSLLGTTYAPYAGKPDDLRPRIEDVAEIIDDFNTLHPEAQLGLEDVSLVHCGLVPMDGLDARTGNVRLTKHYQLHDHSAEGAGRVLSLLGVKYTTARDVAQVAVDRLFRILGKPATRSVSSSTPLQGGEISALQKYLEAELTKRPPWLQEEEAIRLIANYGTAYHQVLKSVETRPTIGPEREGRNAVLAAEVRHAVNEEMALHLSDLVLRRTDVGTAGHPGSAVLDLCARVAAPALGWDETRIAAEVATVDRLYDFRREDEERNEAGMAAQTI